MPAGRCAYARRALRDEVLLFRQAGWRVSYRQPALGTRLPAAVRLERDGAVVTLRIDRWSLPAGAGYAV